MVFCTDGNVMYEVSMVSEDDIRSNHRNIIRSVLSPKIIHFVCELTISSENRLLSWIAKWDSIFSFGRWSISEIIDLIIHLFSLFPFTYQRKESLCDICHHRLKQSRLLAMNFDDFLALILIALGCNSTLENVSIVRRTAAARIRNYTTLKTFSVLRK